MRKQEDAPKSNDGDSNDPDPSCQEEEVKELKETVELQNKTVQQQQVFLEHLANKDCASNLIVTGLLEEGDDSKSVKELIDH